MRGVERADSRRKVGRCSVARYVSTAKRVHSNIKREIVTTAAEESRVDERCRTGRVELRHEDVTFAVIRRVEGVNRHRKVERTSAPRNIRGAGGVQSNATSGVITTAAEESGINERRRTGWVELSHEDVTFTVVRRVEGANSRRKVGR